MISGGNGASCTAARVAKAVFESSFSIRAGSFRVVSEAPGGCGESVQVVGVQVQQVAHFQRGDSSPAFQGILVAFQRTAHVGRKVIQPALSGLHHLFRLRSGLPCAFLGHESRFLLCPFACRLFGCFGLDAQDQGFSLFGDGERVGMGWHICRVLLLGIVKAELDFKNHGVRPLKCRLLGSKVAHDHGLSANAWPVDTAVCLDSLLGDIPPESFPEGEVVPEYLSGFSAHVEFSLVHRLFRESAPSTALLPMLFPEASLPFARGWGLFRRTSQTGGGSCNKYFQRCRCLPALRFDPAASQNHRSNGSNAVHDSRGKSWC